MNMRMWEELVDVWPTVDLDSSVRCVILAGEGPAWCSGMDLAVFAEVCHH
jgi:enoyl-CoA hydratase/carnithine racemase